MSITSKFTDFFARSVCAVLLISPIQSFAADLKSNVPVKGKPAAASEAATSNSRAVVVPLSTTQNAVNVQLQAEARPPVNGVLGVFDFSLTLPTGWSVGSGALAKKALEADGNFMAPSFSFESTKGGVIYGTSKIYESGVIFSPESIAAENPSFPSAWGVRKEDIRSTVSKAGQVGYAVMTASGPGDGLLFSVSGDKRMTAVWIDIPVAYKDKMDVRSAWASVYYRGPVEGDAEAKNIYDAIMGGLKPNGVELMDLSEYRRTYLAKNNAGAAKPPVAPKSEVNKPMDPPKESTATKKMPESEKSVERLEKALERQEKLTERLEKALTRLEKVAPRSFLDILKSD